MRLSYDTATDSLYIHLADRPAVDGVILDYDAVGARVGVDVQHASQNADISTLSLSNWPSKELMVPRCEAALR